MATKNTTDSLIDVIGDILSKPLPGTSDSSNDTGGDNESVFEKIKDVLNNPLPGTKQEHEEVTKNKEYEARDVEEWGEDDDDDVAEKHAGKKSWHALRDVHHDEWEKLKDRHEQERDALKDEHKHEREQLMGRLKVARKGRKERRKHKGKGKGKGRGNKHA